MGECAKGLFGRSAYSQSFTAFQKPFTVRTCGKLLINKLHSKIFNFL